MLGVSPRRLSNKLLLLTLALLVACARAIYVSLYSSDIPFWDQWDLLNRTLAPWWSGHWPPLLEPHNEHRIVFTRLISMGLLALNGGVFSNLVEAYVNTIIYGAVLALFYVLLSRELSGRAARLLLFLVVLAIGCMPFDWENTLVGFQNQFYAMAAIAMLLVALACYRHPSRGMFWMLALLGAASLFTMASGLLGPVAVIAVLILRMWREPVRPGVALAIMVAMALLAATGLLITPKIAGHVVLQARGLGEHIHAMLTFLIWPLQPLTGKRAVFVLVIWWPLIVWLLRFFRTHQASDGELFTVGILCWVLLQGVAFAHARGHDAHGLASRYTDIPSLGLIANFALALRTLDYLRTPVWRKGALALIVLSIGLVGAVFVRELPMQVAAMHQRHESLLVEAHYTRSYLRDRNPEDLHHPGLMIPYINGDKLREYLDTPDIVKLLPRSLLPNDAKNANAHASHGDWLGTIAVSLQHAVQRAFGHRDQVPVYQPRTASPSLSNDAGTCHIDSANGGSGQSTLDLRSGDTLQLDGWLIDASVGQSSMFDILLVGSDTFGITTQASGVRKDVVKAMHSSEDATRGFSTLGILEGIPQGKYAITLATNGVDSRVICRTGLWIHLD